MARSVRVARAAAGTPERVRQQLPARDRGAGVADAPIGIEDVVGQLFKGNATVINAVDHGWTTVGL
jgi:hypothetical protein